METMEVSDLEAARRRRDAQMPPRPPGRGPLPKPPPGWGDDTSVSRGNAVAMSELRRLQNMNAGGR